MSAETWHFPSSSFNIPNYFTPSWITHMYQFSCSFYGVPLWLLSSDLINDVCVAWHKALRKIWRLSPMTHCNVVALISDFIHWMWVWNRDSANSIMAFINLNQWSLRLLLLWQGILPSQSILAIMLNFLQNIKVMLMNVIYLIWSIINSLRTSLKNCNLMLLFSKTWMK